MYLNCIMVWFDLCSAPFVFVRNTVQVFTVCLWHVYVLYKHYISQYVLSKHIIGITKPALIFFSGHILLDRLPITYSLRLTCQTPFQNHLRSWGVTQSCRQWLTFNLSYCSYSNSEGIDEVDLGVFPNTITPCQLLQKGSSLDIRQESSTW